jgi:hypothetical protein
MWTSLEGMWLVLALQCRQQEEGGMREKGRWCQVVWGGTLMDGLTGTVAQSWQLKVSLGRALHWQAANMLLP